MLYRLFPSFFIGFVLVTGHLSLVTGEIKDRVVAFVDNTAITLSELEMKYADTIKITPKVTKDEVLNAMINKLLLLKEARKIGLDAPSEEELLKEYIDLKIRAFIRIKEEELSEFYNKHITDFKGREFESVREEIERYLVENELNRRLKLHIEELKKKICVRIQLNQEGEK